MSWESDEVLEHFIDKNFPDMRKIVSMVQDLYNSYKSEPITMDKVESKQYSFIDLYLKLIETPNPKANYETIMQNYQGKSDDIFISLSNEFPQWIFEKKPALEPKVPNLIKIIGEWDYKRKFLIDENLGILACFFECQNFINQK